MTSFDELIGTEPGGAERERLRSVHELLLEAGSPPELSPELAGGPRRVTPLSSVRSLSRGRRRFVLTTAAAAFVALLIGISFGIHGHGNRYPSMSLQGTSFAPGATGTLDILPAKGAKPRLKLEVQGLPPVKGRYVVYLVRNGRPVAPCGSFAVSNANRQLTKVLVSPYPLKGSDTWVVTVSRHGETPGVTVLRAVT